MPYVPRRDRVKLDDPTAWGPSNPGELNYQLTNLCNNYLNSKGLCYETLNAIVGALECAKMEYYRRMAVPYEDGKMNKNGEVYPVEMLNGG